jgi:hypothetical protein
VRQDEAIELSSYSQKIRGSEFDGAPEEIRTPDPQIRSLVLEPKAKGSTGLQFVRIWTISKFDKGATYAE